MTARRAEPMALGDGLTTRRAPPQRGTAISAKPVAIPPGRTAPRTRHHHTFIPPARPSQPGNSLRTPTRQPLITRPEPRDLHATVSAVGVPSNRPYSFSRGG